MSIRGAASLLRPHLRLIPRRRVELLDRLAVGEVPDADFAVPAARRGAMPVGADRDGVDLVVQARQRPYGAAVFLPDADGFVRAGGDQPRLARDRDHAIDLVAV